MLCSWKMHSNFSPRQSPPIPELYLKKNNNKKPMKSIYKCSRTKACSMSVLAMSCLFCKRALSHRVRSYTGNLSAHTVVFVLSRFNKSYAKAPTATVKTSGMWACNWHVTQMDAHRRKHTKGANSFLKYLQCVSVGYHFNIVHSCNPRWNDSLNGIVFTQICASLIWLCVEFMPWLQGWKCEVISRPSILVQIEISQRL